MILKCNKQGKDAGGDNNGGETEQLQTIHYLISFFTLKYKLGCMQKAFQNIME